MFRVFQEKLSSKPENENFRKAFPLKARRFESFEVEKDKDRGCLHSKRQKNGIAVMEFTETSKNFFGVEKMHTIQNFENFAAFNCLPVIFGNLNINRISTR